LRWSKAEGEGNLAFRLASRVKANCYTSNKNIEESNLKGGGPVGGKPRGKEAKGREHQRA